MKAEFRNMLLQQTLISGKPGEIKCTGEGTPVPQFEWERNGSKMFDDGRFTKGPNGNLRVSSVLPGDEGLYKCIMKQNKKSSTGTEKQYINVSVIGR